LSSPFFSFDPFFLKIRLSLYFIIALVFFFPLKGKVPTKLLEKGFLVKKRLFPDSSFPSSGCLG